MPSPYYSYSDFLQKTYGGSMHRVPIDLGYGCPNRDADGRGGCAFCAANGARAQQTIHAETVEEQVRQAIEFARRRYGAKRFMAYLQAFTGTFAPASEQRLNYEALLNLFPFDALTVGTRPDCLAPETIDFLVEMNRRLDVWVELGVQTMQDATLRRINRGHNAAASRGAIRRLYDNGVKVVAHVILGLPGERPAQFKQTAEQLAALPIDGIKLHNLHVVKGTALDDEFQRNPFPVLNEHEYAEVLIEFLRRIPAHIPILRVQTDTPADELVAPVWSMDKPQFLDMLVRQMRFRRVCQGDLVDASQSPDFEPMEPVVTDDGSVTFWSSHFKEHYHTPVGARGEALHKYVEPSALAALAEDRRVRLLDVCFGLGYNSLVAAEVAARGHGIDITALEIDKGVVADAAAHCDNPMLRAVAQTGQYVNDKMHVHMLWGDARHTITTLADQDPFDLIFLDAFSTQRNSELWTVEFFQKLRAVLADRGKILTYCAALPVRAGLMEAGFHVGNTPAFGRDRAGTIAVLDPADIEFPLEQQERENMATSTKGIPFHDPHGTWTNKEILRHREDAVRRFKSGA